MNSAETDISLSGIQHNPAQQTGLSSLEFDNSRPRTAHELVYSTLRRTIIGGELPPGTRLTQSAVAKSLRVSTTPVREALSRLAADGLVQIDTHRGAIVRGFDEHELVEIYELRMLLEPLALKKAAPHLTDSELAQAAVLCDRMDDHSDPQAWAEHNRQFHSVLVSSAKSPNLQTIITALQDKSTYYVQLSLIATPSRFTSANNHHRQILSALNERDGAKAAALESAHLNGTLQALTARIHNQVS